MTTTVNRPEPAPIGEGVEIPASAKRRRNFLLLAMLIGLAILARLTNLDGRLVDLDAWRQTDTASIARLFVSEPNIFYPRIYWGAPGPGYVEAEFQLYPYLVSLAYRAFGENALYGRLLSIGLCMLSSLIFYRIARRYLDFWPAYVSVSFFLFAPIVFRYSRQFMPEASMLLFYLLALERFLVFLDTGRWRTILAAGVAMSLAILIKPTSIHIGFALMGLSFLRFGRYFWAKPKLIAFAIISLVPPTLYYLHAMNIYFTYGNTFGVIAGGDSKWTLPSQFISFHFYRSILQMDVTWILGIGGTVIAILGAAVYRRPGWLASLGWWGASFAIYCLALGRYIGDYGKGLHYHIFAVPLLALAAGGGVAALQRKMPRF